MATEEKTTFGLTVEPTGTDSKTLTPQPSRDSELSGSHTPKSNSDPANPFSAFYSHGSARRSREDLRAAAAAAEKTTPAINVYEPDLEGQALTRHQTPSAHNEDCLQQHEATPKLSVDGRVKECTMWPSRQTLQAEEKQRRAARSWNPLANLKPKQKLWVKILIALVIVALAVGLGVGISRAVGGGVWAGQGQTKTIPKNGD